MTSRTNHTRRSSAWKPIVVLVGAVCAGAFAVYAAMVPIFTHIQTEFFRIGVILEALRESEAAPEIVFLGNSVGLYGIDARLISERLEGSPLALNLTSGAQQLAESFLYYQELPGSVRTVLQLVPPIGIGESQPFGGQRYNTFFMYGYRANEFTSRSLTEAYGESMAEILAQPAWRQKFRARWALRNVIEMQARSWLRPELDLASTQRDLFFPNPEERPLPEAKRDRLVRKWIERWPVHEFEAVESQLVVLQATLAAARAANREIVYLLPPEHPVVRAARGDELYEGFRKVLARELEGVTVIDGLELLDEELFVDNVHPTRTGARIWSEFVAERLRTVR